MSGLGRGIPVHFRGTSGNLANVTSGNAVKTDDSYRRFYPLGQYTISNLRPFQLPNCECSIVSIRNPEGNNPVYIGGTGNLQAQIGICDILYETELRHFLVNNANEISVIAQSNNTQILVSTHSNIDQNITTNNPGPPDVTAPTVSSTSPASAATNVPINSSIFFLFSEEIQTATINTTNITIAPAISYTVAKDSVNPLKISIIPAANLALSTVYTITAKTGLRDLADNALAVQFSASFTTAATLPGADVTPPTVVSTNPANDATSISLSIAPAISFSEVMLSSTMIPSNFVVFKDTTNTPITVAAVVLSADSKTATLTISGLEYSTKYRIEVGVGVKDLAGNALAAKFTTFFTTVAPTSIQLYSLTGNADLQMYSGSYTIVYEICATTKSYLYNNVIRRIVFESYKVGSPTGTLTVVITDSGGSIKHTFSDTLNVTTLTTTYKQYTLTSSANAIIMGTGYKIGIRYSGGDSFNYISVRYVSGSSYNAADSYLQLLYAGFYNLDYTDSDLGAIMSTG